MTTHNEAATADEAKKSKGTHIMTRHIGPISGKDSLAAVWIQRQLHPDLPYELMYNPTGAETPEVDAWLDRVSAAIGLPIARVGENLENIIEEQGILPSMLARYCTRLAKIHPMEDWIGSDPAIVYYGIRADETRGGYSNPKKPHIQPAYPLVAAGMGIDDVWRLLDSIGLLPPSFFWPSLHARVVARLGSYADVLDTLHPLKHRQLFAGRSRMNCSFCFFQRGYEWIWLLETHPALYWRAAKMEETIGGDGYTWRQGQRLRTLATRADQVIDRRARKIVKILMPQQAALWDDDDEGDIPDLLQVVSCGLLCGK